MKFELGDEFVRTDFFLFDFHYLVKVKRERVAPNKSIARAFYEI